MTVYWKIHNTEYNLIKYYTCDVCKFLHAKANRRKAIAELRGINDDIMEDNTEGQIFRVCDTHLQELKDAGEVEA